jgi:ParB/RepB/Spo0J family partition protein
MSDPEDLAQDDEIGIEPDPETRPEPVESSDPDTWETPEGMPELDATTDKALAGRISLRLLAIENVMPDPDQPRKTFGNLIPLADNMRQVGMEQPIKVRPHPTQRGLHMIVDGERRWRAARLAKWTHVPVIVEHNKKQKDVLPSQLAANLFSEVVNPMDEAAAIRRWMHEQRIATYAEAAKRLGHSQNWVTNRNNLLDLPEADQDRVRAGTLSIVDGAKRARDLKGTSRPRSDSADRPTYTTRPAGSGINGGFAAGRQPTSGDSGAGTYTPPAPSTYPPPRSEPAAEPAEGEPYAVDAWYNHEHPLAARASGRCQHRHQRRKLVPGGVACAECWEVTIRRDERLNPTEIS